MIRFDKSYTILLICLILTPSNKGFCQKIIFAEDYKSLIDIDENNWNTSIEFKKGDTARLISFSKTDRNYFKISAAGKTMFVYKTVVKEADNYFEGRRGRMDSLKLFVIIKQTNSFRPGDTVKLIDARPGSMGVPTVKISNGTIEEETTIENLEDRPILKEAVETLIRKHYETESKMDAKALAERNKRLKQKYGEANFNRLMKGEIWIGMTEEMFVELKGQPKKISKTATSYGESQQWVYGLGEYYYFKAGKLTGWQN